MISERHDWIRAHSGAAPAGATERVQSLWGGYGELLRVPLVDGRSVIVKEVRPGHGGGVSHERKLRSYDVEHAFYRDHAPVAGARVARCLATERSSDGWRFLLEDLDRAGYAGRARVLTGSQTAHALDWLARFHARFLDRAPDGLWDEGTYWHLATRPAELAELPEPALRSAAAAIDARLRAGRFRTLVHGDAKPANFCFGADGAAAVDFQYVGGGCGMKDVAYLLFAHRGWGAGDGGTGPLLDHYFAALRSALAPGLDGEALEAEWRRLYPLARVDFLRFMAGWSPSRDTLRDYRDALAALG
ncbi:MAG: choline kinase [Sandaracinus sp.]|nr:choline kinase [Sandaracinus sp.]